MGDVTEPVSTRCAHTELRQSTNQLWLGSCVTPGAESKPQVPKPGGSLGPHQRGAGSSMGRVTGAPGIRVLVLLFFFFFFAMRMGYAWFYFIMKV